MLSIIFWSHMFEYESLKCITYWLAMGHSLVMNSILINMLIIFNNFQPLNINLMVLINIKSITQ